MRLITIECVEEIAAVAGRRAEVAAITETAMRGEIADYKESLRRRVALLEGVPAEALQSGGRAENAARLWRLHARRRSGL